MQRQCAVTVQAAHNLQLTFGPAARAPPCRSSCVDACEIFCEPASRLRFTPLWDGWAKASAAPVTGKVPMNPHRWSAYIFPTGTGRLVCVRALLTQFRFFRPESWCLVLAAGGGRTHGCQKNASRNAHRDSARVGGENFGRKEFPPPCIARVSRRPAIPQTFRAPFSRHCLPFRPLTKDVCLLLNSYSTFELANL